MPFDSPKPDGYIHYSQIATYLQCPKKHEFSYIEQLEPKEASMRMLFGTFGHAHLADLWAVVLGQMTPNGPEALAKALSEAESPEAQSEINTIYLEAREVAVRAFERLHPRFKPYNHQGKVMIEQPLVVMVHGRPVGGTPDAVLVDTNDGSVWIVDYKFRKTFQQPESENLNLQAVFYQGLASQHGIDVLGTFQYQIKPSMPKAPKLNKNGSMSKADLMTDWDTYEASLLSNGLNPADYEEMRDKLAGKVFFDLDTCRAYRPMREVDHVWKNDIGPTVKEIATGTPRTTRCYFFKSCELCSFQELCIEDAKGGDTEWLVGTRYKKKGERGYLMPIIEED